MMDIASGFMQGLATAMTGEALLFCLIGVTIGTLVGALPGIGAMATISIVLPVTFTLKPLIGLIMLAGIFYGAQYGGSIASILLSIPGMASSAVTCLDGYPMARQGKAGVALLVTSVSSFVGGTVSILLLMLLAPTLAEFALRFSSVEYFLVMFLGLMGSATISSGSPVKGLTMVVLGVALGTVGTDVNSGIFRFTFGTLQLQNGFGFIAVAMGLFGVAEILSNVGKPFAMLVSAKSITVRSMLPSRQEARACVMPTVRGTGLGALFGFIPGAGSTISSYMSYALEKRLAKDPSRFGQGAVEGVAAPEAANNAAVQTSFIPMLSLGIPTDPTLAILMAAMIVHGINPGPQFITEHAPVFWGLVASFWVGNVLLLILNIPFIGLWVRLLSVPYKFLYPAVLFFVAIGVYSINNDPFDVYVAGLIGLGGYLLVGHGYPPAALLIGLVIGPMMEEHLKRAMLMSRGSFSIFLERPISAVLLAVIGLVAASTVVRLYRGRSRLAAPANP